MEQQVREWLGKIEEFKKGNVDLSRDEDLSIALMNLISLEEHFFFTAMKTENRKYFGMLNSVRKLRIELLKKIVVEPKGEEWCISKHLLAASMRLVEVGTKELAKKNNDGAEKMFSNAFSLYSLFFAINLGMIKKEKLNNAEVGKESRAMGKFSAILKKILDCCKEWWQAP